jgi:hypothetical protein
MPSLFLFVFATIRRWWCQRDSFTFSGRFRWKIARAIMEAIEETTRLIVFFWTFDLWTFGIRITVLEESRSMIVLLERCDQSFLAKKIFADVIKFTLSTYPSTLPTKPKKWHYYFFFFIKLLQLLGTTLLKEDEGRHVLLKGGDMSYLMDETRRRHVLVVWVLNGKTVQIDR